MLKKARCLTHPSSADIPPAHPQSAKQTLHPETRRSTGKAAASEDEASTSWYVEGLSDARTKPGERRVSARRGWAGEKSDFFSILLDGRIGKTQGEETADASFLRSEKTGKTKPDPFGTTGTHNGAVNHDGIIVLGRMKLQHHLASHRNTLAGAYTAPSERQVREYPLNHDTLAGIINRANRCGILDRDSVIVTARISFDLTEEGSKAVCTELAAKWIDGQGAEEPISHPIAWGEFCLQCPAFRARAGAHCR